MRMRPFFQNALYENSSQTPGLLPKLIWSLYLIPTVSPVYYFGETLFGKKVSTCPAIELG
ncbi:hypothetical protein B7P43_G17969 [Cryptotermes secundus]|uniref:Uncharacterized protein n=1 Tax=Cryptotermes secundus TaxID=105785 RepID=A0A2J7QCS3_9NEOP|nr:hypothetical protein B7P43_G17969 [Cryptotermes secundus]